MDNTNYKELYLKMVRASERAINILVEAQQECEELYLSADGDESEVKSPSLSTVLSENQTGKTGG